MRLYAAAAVAVAAAAVAMAAAAALIRCPAPTCARVMAAACFVYDGASVTAVFLYPGTLPRL